MEIDVHMLDTATGERAIYRTDELEPTEDELREYMWSDGNWGCDCNRSDFFHRARGWPEPERVPCGDERYKVEKIVERGTERVLYSDDPDEGFGAEA